MEFSIQNQNQGKKMTGAIFAALFNGAFVWALINGLGTHPPIHPPKPPVDVTLLPDKPVELPPPSKPVDVKPVHFVPPPVIMPPDVQPDARDKTIKSTTAVEPDDKGDHRIEQHGEDEGIHDIRVPAVVDANACERPEYPGDAISDGLTGTTGLQFLIGVDGKVVESKVIHSSGSRELDRAALAGLTRCKFKAGTVNGKPVASWTNINYAWRLE